MRGEKFVFLTPMQLNLNNQIINQLSVLIPLNRIKAYNLIKSIYKMKSQAGKEENSCEEQLLKAKYQTIPYETRKLLIRMVIRQKISVYRASKELNINNSTAKVIVRNYKRKGTIFRRKSEQISKKSVNSNQHLQQRQQNRQTIEVQPPHQQNTEAINGWFWPIWTYQWDLGQIYHLNPTLYFQT